MKTSDKLAIHELLSRAAYGLDEHDLDRIEACFAPEASMTVKIAGMDPIGPFEGRDAIMGLMRDSVETQTEKRRHVVSNIFFEAEGESEATVMSNLTLFGTEDGANKLITTGVYRDMVTKTGDDWLIASRDISLDLPY